jgi:class 3 adenylate cyclase
MECIFSEYDRLKCSERIESVLSASDSSFEDVDEIPARTKLTFDNGYYVNCSSIFVDIRNSSGLPKIHRRPVLARLYRAFISEVTAAMAGDPNIAEVNIIGDCVSGIFNARYKNQIQRTFETTFVVSSAINLLNYKFKKNGIQQIEVGIGMSYGRALMTKAGKKGTGVNDVVWMGDVVNEASNLSCAANDHKLYPVEIMISESIFINLDEYNQKLVHKDPVRGVYYGNIVDIEMQKWFNENCKS